MRGTFLTSRTALTAADSDTCEMLQDIPELTKVVVDVKQSRNPQFHAYAFTMLGKLHEMADVETPFDPWRKYLTIKAGYCKTTGFPDGSVLVEADSLNWQSMSQARFKQVWLDLHQTFVNIYGNKLSMEDLETWAMM